MICHRFNKKLQYRPENVTTKLKNLKNLNYLLIPNIFNSVLHLKYQKEYDKCSFVLTLSRFCKYTEEKIYNHFSL